MRITLVTLAAVVVMALGMFAASGFIQGQYDTIPEGVTWMRQILETSVTG